MLKLTIATCLTIVSLATACQFATVAMADDFENFAAASPWGRYYSMSPGQKQQVDMRVATEKATGKTVNVITLANGHMMVLVPAERFMSLVSPVPAEEMLPAK